MSIYKAKVEEVCGWGLVLFYTRLRVMIKNNPQPTRPLLSQHFLSSLRHVLEGSFRLRDRDSHLFAHRFQKRCFTDGGRVVQVAGGLDVVAKDPFGIGREPLTFSG